MQAAILQLYDPDRAQYPTYRTEPISWHNLIEKFSTLRDQRKSAQGEDVRLLVAPVTSPTLRRQIKDWLSEFPNTRILLLDPAGIQERRVLTAAAYGEEFVLHYR